MIFFAAALPASSARGFVGGVFGGRRLTGYLARSMPAAARALEASHFTHDQLRMIADFVSQRGGGLLMLGGRLSYSLGGYAGDRQYLRRTGSRLLAERLTRRQRDQRRDLFGNAQRLIFTLFECLANLAATLDDRPRFGI